MSSFYFFKVFSYLRSNELNELSDVKNQCIHRAIHIILASTTKLKKKYYTEEKREYSLFKDIDEIMKIEFMNLGYAKSDINSKSEFQESSKPSENEDNYKTKVKNKNKKNKNKNKSETKVDINEENDLEKETGSIITTDDEGNEIIDLAKIKTTSPVLNVGDVLLKCVKEGSKLRVKIISDGYFNEANCQFPKDIRKEGRIFKVKAKDVILAEGKAGKYFYRVKSGIEIYNEGSGSIQNDVTKVKIFEDKKESDCAVCLTVPKTTVIVPCGHFYTCNSCAKQLDKCPICRGGISKLIDKTKME